MRLASLQQSGESSGAIPILPGESIDQAIDRWIGVVARIARIGDRERTELQDELAAHLHDRVRDLVLSGHDEQDALRRALAELGDAAQLAREISEAHRYPRRRLIMNCTIIGLGLAAVGVGVVSVGGALPFAQSRAFNAQEVERIEDVLTTRADIEFTDMQFDEVIEAFDAMTDRSIYVHWNDLSYSGYDRGDSHLLVSLDVQGIALGKAMDLALDQVSDGELAWRISEDLIELGVADVFDRREATLVSYEVGGIIDHLWATYDIEDGAEHISDLLLEMVEPDHWQHNGGEIARFNIVGGKMFVEAPPRMHERIAWLLAELGSDPGDATEVEADR